MACTQQCAVEYLQSARCKLVTHMQNLPLIIENLYQRKVFNDHEVDDLKAERTEFDKAKSILDWVIKKGEEASYELLRILDFTRKRTLHSDSHIWIIGFPFREDADVIYSFGTKPCQDYQNQLRDKAKNILENQWKQSCKYLHNSAQTNFSYVPLVLETSSVVKDAQSKIKMMFKKCKKTQSKKLRSYVPDQQETLSPEDLLKSKSRNIMLLGKPGIGKTTVVQQMLKMWTEKFNKYPYYMFYFDETHIYKQVNLKSLLFGYSTPSEKDKEEVYQDIEENSENVVIVFDGVTCVQEHSILKKIMDQDLLPDAKIIITCRTELEDELDWSSQKVYVQGFSEESINTYYQMMLSHKPDLLHVVLTNQELFSLSHVPMYAFMIVAFILFKNDTVSSQSNTVTEMYIHIFLDASKKCGRKNTGEMDHYLRQEKDHLYPLMKNAFTATVQKSLNLPEISSDETNICHAFLKTITSLTSKTKYCAFLHNTMQEFFSALWLIENPDEIEEVLNMCQTEENQHMRHVLPFLCGLLGEHNSKLLKCLFPEDQMKKISDGFIEKLLDTFLESQTDGDIDLLYVCQCLYELQSSNACLMFLEKMKHELDIDVNLDPHQSCALSYVISQSRDKEVHLNLENCTVSDTGMIMILTCSPQMRLKLWNEPLQQIKHLIEFCHKVLEKYGTITCCCTSDKPQLSQALLDLCSHVMDCETQTGKSFLPALKSVYQSPDAWIIHLSERKTSILLEVLKLQTEKKTVVLRGWTEEESEVRSFLHCLPFISELRFHFHDTSLNRFLMELFIKAAESERDKGDQMLKLLISVCPYTDYLNEDTDVDYQSNFLLDLYSQVMDCETQTGRSFLPELKSVYIHASPDVWTIDLSERKASILLEVLKLRTEKKPVELIGWTEEESEVRSFLHCLPFISQLRFGFMDNMTRMSAVRFLLSCVTTGNDINRGTSFIHQLSSVCSYRTFPFDEEYYDEYDFEIKLNQSDFLLDLYSQVMDCETQTGRSFPPALQSVYQSPDVWITDLSERKGSILLEVLKLQTEKKPVELRGWTEEESEVRSYLHCLPFISQLRFAFHGLYETRFVLRLFITAAESERHTGDQMLKLLTSVCAYTTFPFKDMNSSGQSDFLLDLYSHVMDCETQTGKSFLPALQSVYQSPDVWTIDLSKRKASILLEVLKLQTKKKPVELRGWTEEESEMMSFLHCLPFISQLRFAFYGPHETRFLLRLFITAAERSERHTEDQMLKLLSSVCAYTTFPYKDMSSYYQSDFLLDLYSQVMDCETQTGRSFLPELQSVYQSPDVWSIDHSKGKASILLEVLKLQTEKKPVELRGWTEEESEVRSFLHCLPFISQLRFAFHDLHVTRFLLRLFITAAEMSERHTGDQMLKLLTSVCAYTTFPYENMNNSGQSDFLLDLYSQVMDCETQTGRSFLPELKSVYQSPDVWITDLSERKASILLEVLKLQTEKKPVELRGWTEEESEVRSFLHCLPFISQLRLAFRGLHVTRFLLRLFITAAEMSETHTGDQMLELLTSVCAYTTFPYKDMNSSGQSDFLLDLYSQVMDWETQTGRSFLPALKSVYQSPDVWSIDLSKRKASILLEVLKLQTEKKPVELRGWTEEESEVRSFLHCLPFISQLSGAERCVLSFIKLVEFRENPELVISLFQALDFNLSLEGILPSSTCRFVGGVLHQSADRLTLTVRPRAISLRGTRHLFRRITNIHTLRLSGFMVVRIVRALRSGGARVPVSVNELSVDLNDELRSGREMSRVQSSLASLLRFWSVQCLNLTDCRTKSLSLILLLSQQSPKTLRLSKETLQMLTECVYEAQEETLALCFLEKVGRDLSSCSLSWEKLYYFLQCGLSSITVDCKRTDMSLNIREILPFLNKIHFQRMSSSFLLCLIREIHESRCSGFVSGLLSSVKNCINLQNRALDSGHCAALCFILQHCTALTLNMLWTSIPEVALESILPLFSHVSCLSVDRVLLLRMIHCCSSSDVQQEASAVLLSALQHKLDFSWGSALDLTENTCSQPLELTIRDCHVISVVIQRASRDTHIELNLHDCQINSAGIYQLFTILNSVQLKCAKATLLQFLSHVDAEKAESLSRALGEEVDLSDTHLDLQACGGLALVLDHSEGLTELDLSQCHLTDGSLTLLLPNLHKAQTIDFSGNSITDSGAQNIYSIVSHNSNIKTVRLFKNKIESRDLFHGDPRFEIW